MAHLNGTLMEEELHSTFKGDPYGRSMTDLLKGLGTG